MSTFTKIRKQPKEVLLKKLEGLRHNEKNAPSHNEEYKRLADELEILIRGLQ